MGTDESARLDRLLRELASFRDECRASFKRDKAKTRRFVVATTTATAGVTAVLALGGPTEKAGWQIWLAALLALLATVLQAWDGVFDHKGLWLNRGLTIARLDHLASRIIIAIGPGDVPATAQLDGWLKEFNTIRRDDREGWRSLGRKPGG